MELEKNEKTVMLREIGMQADFVRDNIDSMLGFKATQPFATG